MNNQKTTNLKPEICTIRILFPTDSDEKALEIKRKISEVLSETPEAQVTFGLTPIAQTRPPIG